MHKLQFDVSELRVESFDTTDRDPGPFGTVFGYPDTEYDHGCTEELGCTQNCNSNYITYCDPGCGNFTEGATCTSGLNCYTLGFCTAPENTCDTTCPAPCSTCPQPC